VYESFDAQIKHLKGLHLHELIDRTRKVPVRCHGHTNLNKIIITPKIMSHMMLINNVMQSIMTNIMVNIMHDVNPVTIDQ
jgi:hypothetical protein